MKPQNHTPTLNAQEKLDWLRLIRTENVGPITFYRLIETYGSARRAIEAIPELAKRGGKRAPVNVPSLAQAERELEQIHKSGAQLLLSTHASYPAPLASLEDAPPVLCVRGDVSLLGRPCIGIVGARNASLNGRRFTQQLADDLGQAGQIVVSGLARGIDTAAHEGALPHGTVAVVAGGVDVVYPPENQKLYDQIAESGAIVAESPFGQQPFSQSFPRRNRIISGLSSGIVVVEATERSGSLITARMAGEQGRDVYAVPGHPMDPRASGPNLLLRDGAILIRSASDVLENINNLNTIHMGEAPQDPFDDLNSLSLVINDDPAAFERARRWLLDNLSFTPSDCDTLIRESRLGTQMIQTVLLELELAGIVQRLPGNRVCLIGEAD